MRKIIAIASLASLLSATTTFAATPSKPVSSRSEECEVSNTSARLYRRSDFALILYAILWRY